MTLLQDATSRYNFDNETKNKSREGALPPPPPIPSAKIAAPLKKPFWRSPLNLVTLIIPNAISILYFGLLASPVYVSTTSLLVTNPVKDSDSLTSLLSGSSGSSSDGAYVLKSFIDSWDEYRHIDEHYNLAQSYSQGDFYARYAGPGMLFQDNDVARWHYYQRMINVEIDERSGITTVNVRGFKPDIAYQIARTVVSDAIAHINSMNQSSEQNFASTAAKQTQTLRNAIAADELALSIFRTRNAIYDPEQYNEALLSEVQTLSTKKVDINAQYQALIRSTPSNPMTTNYQTQMAVMQKAISDVTNGAGTIIQITPAYNALALRRDTDVALLKEAEIAAQEASFKAGQNRYSLNMISAPSLPHAAELPHSLYRVLEIAAITLLVRLIAG